jgi:hypothetical protein
MRTLPGSRAARRLTLECLSGLAVALAMIGCSGVERGDPLPPPSPPVAAPPVTHGRFVGTAKIGTEEYFADLLVTVDGAVRLYVGTQGSDSGVLELSPPDSSAQLVGSLTVLRGGLALGNGVVIGQGCAQSPLARFCVETGSAALSATFDSSEIEGEILVTRTTGSERWLISAREWNWYAYPAEVGPLAGHYREVLAEFAAGDTVIMSIDRAGRLFFQGTLSGCIGNGTLAAHLDGSFDVYDAQLVIENCAAPYAHLNGEYDGLSVTTPSNYWNYDFLLRTWLTKRGAGPSVALTLLADPVY